MKIWIAKVRFVSLLVVAVASCASAWAGDHSAIKDALEAKYQLTKTGVDRVRITQPGTVFIVQKDGISGDLASDMTFLNNKVHDGQVAQAGGFMASMQGKTTSRDLKSGDKVYLFRIDVKDDQVQFFVITCDTYDVNVHGSTKQTRYKAQLSFEFGKDFMASATPEATEKAIETVIIPEAEAQAANTKTVELGQTPDQVKSAVGAPDKIIKLGAKEVYVYKDMKVVFVDGKVSDVQ
jgi:hypothetical protein